MAVKRASWGSRKVSAPKDSQPKRELYIHHEAGPVRAEQSAAEEKQVMREIQAFHINSRGFKDIGYSYVLFPSGRLYEGRGFGALPAAQEGHNSGTVAICCAGHYDKQQLTPAQKKRLVTAANNLAKRGVKTVAGHREAPGQSTACPGKNVTGHLDELARASKLTRG